MIRYSASTGGFHHGKAAPADAVKISAKEHRGLIHGQTQGFEIKPDGEGRPVLVPLAPPSEDVLWARVRARRNHLLAATDWTQLPDVPGAVRARWAARRKYLRDVPQTQTDPRSIDYGHDPA